MIVNKLTTFLETLDLNLYRQRFLKIKIVEMDLPKNIQAISLLYKIYWSERRFINYDDFYKEYLKLMKYDIESFRIKISMCERCFYLGLPARIYRTWASIITQIHAGYVAESVFGQGSVEMSEQLDHMGADFRVTYRGEKINYQVKKQSHSREIRQQRVGRVKLDGEFIDILYNVPSNNIFENPKTKMGELRKPYRDFLNNKNLRRLDNGFVIFTKVIFENKKKEIDNRLT
jgi:hypothetical protein